MHETYPSRAPILRLLTRPIAARSASYVIRIVFGQLTSPPAHSMNPVSSNPKTASQPNPPHLGGQSTLATSVVSIFSHRTESPPSENIHATPR